MLGLILTISLEDGDGEDVSIGNWKWEHFRSTEFSATQNLLLPSAEGSWKRPCIMVAELQGTSFTYKLGMPIEETLTFLLLTVFNVKLPND